SSATLRGQPGIDLEITEAKAFEIETADRGARRRRGHDGMTAKLRRIDIDVEARGDTVSDLFLAPAEIQREFRSHRTRRRRNRIEPRRQRWRKRCNQCR